MFVCILSKNLQKSPVRNLNTGWIWLCCSSRDWSGESQWHTGQLYGCGLRV